MKTNTNLGVASALALAVVLIPAQTDAQAAQEFYDGIKSVYLHASVDVKILSPLYEGHDAPIQGVGLVEHWEQGDRFRTVVWVDPKLGLMTNLEIAFDGEHYQMHFLDTRTLANEQPTFRMGELLQVPTPIPNPFYLPVKYLAPSDDDCPGCQLTLGFVKSDQIWPKIPLARGMKSAIIDVVGGARAGEGYNFRIHRAPAAGFKTGADTMGGLKRIDRVGIDTLLRESIEFSQFEDGFPRAIRFSGYEPAKDSTEAVVVVEYKIEELILNSSIDDSVFMISPEAGTAVWDNGTPVPLDPN